MKHFSNTLRTALGATALVALGSTAQADIVHLDDVIVDGSICVGLDCVNGESFGFDTLRLKENNLRIKAQDTSNSASFPTNDWQITFNETSNGGANKFSIDDIDGGRTPFTIEASAPSNSLYVDDGGRLGFGTSTPVVELHVVNGDTPTLRLEQNGSSGFTPQTWDVAGNEAGFFVRDVTNGSTLPFRIIPTAPSQSLVIDADGQVVMGSGTVANAQLHVIAGGAAQNTGTADDVIIQDDGPARMALINTAATVNTAWTFNSNNTLRISAGTDASEFEFTNDGIFGTEGTCMEFNINTAGSQFACTFTVGGGVSCTGVGTTCP